MSSREVERSTSFISEAKGILIALIFAYSLKSGGVSIVSLDPVFLIWIGILIYSIKFFRKKGFAASFLVYALFLFTYTVGGLLYGYSIGDLIFLRIFITQLLLAGLVAATLPGGYNAVRAKKSILANRVELAMLLAVTAWIYVINLEQTHVEYAVRALGAENYLTLSDLLAMFALLSLSGGTSSRAYKILWLALVSVALMMLGSRATVVMFLLCSLVALGVDRYGEIYRVRLRPILVGLSVMTLSTIAFLTVFGETITYRMLTLLHLSTDPSSIAREQYLHNYTNMVADNLGCLAFPCMPSNGEYVHSILSVIQYFGSIGALALLIGAVATVSAFYRGWRPQAPALFIFCLLSMLIARPWIAMPFPVLVGYGISAVLYSRIKYVENAQLDENELAKNV